jgi:rod shape-determining protein MreC
VGIVTTVNARFSVIIPLLHPKSRVSGKLSHGEYFGILSWDGRDAQYANLEELPTHTEFQEGDIVVTSGFSAVFPPGIIVGTVVQSENSRNTGLYSLKVKLATDFQRLTTVRVIKNNYQNEQWKVEQEAKRND